MSTDDPQWASEKLRVIEQRLSEAKGWIARLTAKHRAAAVMTGDRRYRTLRSIEKEIEQAEIHKDKLERERDACRQSLEQRHEQAEPVRMPKAVKPPSPRDEQIYSIIEKGLKGRRYATAVQSAGVRTPESWRKKGCPHTYPKAYDADERWRTLIRREKHRIRKRIEESKTSLDLPEGQNRRSIKPA